MLYVKVQRDSIFLYFYLYLIDFDTLKFKMSYVYEIIPNLLQTKKILILYCLP